MNARRRILVAVGAGGLCFALHAFAQQPSRVRRIGYFSTSSLQASRTWLAAFREGMSELHWVEGRDYVLDDRYTNNVTSAAPTIASDLVASKPDVLLVSGDSVVPLLLQKTNTIPIVFAMGTDPVGMGIAQNLRRPGGKMTGLTILANDLGAKRLQLLKEAFPRIAHVAVLFESNHGSSLTQIKGVEEGASRLGMRVTAIGLQAANIESAFKRGAAIGAQAYIAIGGSLVNNERRAIVDGVVRSKMPGMFGGNQYAEAGGLMSYAPLFPDNFRRAAAYVDKILKGVNPGELPIEQPTKFELVVNMKTAKAMGLTIPQSILLRADRVIE